MAVESILGWMSCGPTNFTNKENMVQTNLIMHEVKSDNFNDDA